MSKEKVQNTLLVTNIWNIPWEDLHKRDPLPRLSGVNNTLSCDIAFLRQVLILFCVEKHLSDLAVVIGVVMSILTREDVLKIVPREELEQNRTEHHCTECAYM